MSSIDELDVLISVFENFADILISSIEHVQNVVEKEHSKTLKKNDEIN